MTPQSQGQPGETLPCPDGLPLPGVVGLRGGHICKQPPGGAVSKVTPGHPGGAEVTGEVIPVPRALGPGPGSELSDLGVT